MDEFLIFLDDWSQPCPTLKTCNTNHKAESQHKSKSKKITKQNLHPTKIIRDKLEKTN